MKEFKDIIELFLPVIILLPLLGVFIQHFENKHRKKSVQIFPDSAAGIITLNKTETRGSYSFNIQMKDVKPRYIAG